MAPTRPPSTTRGSRICQTIAGRAPACPSGSAAAGRARRSARHLRRGRRPARSDTERGRHRPGPPTPPPRDPGAAGSEPADRRRRLSGGSAGAVGAVAVVSRLASGCCLSASATRAQQVTIRGPQREAMSSLSPTTWPSLTAPTAPTSPVASATVAAALPAADRVGQEDVVRVGLEDELGRQLRVAAAGRGPLGRVGDAAAVPRSPSSLPDEGRGRHRVVGVSSSS